MIQAHQQPLVIVAPIIILPLTVMCLQLQSVTVDIGKLAGDYTKPGQFIQVKVGDTKPGFFAIASPPDPNNQGLVELLIKRQGDTAEAICSVATGMCHGLLFLDPSKIDNIQDSVANPSAKLHLWHNCAGLCYWINFSRCNAFNLTYKLPSSPAQQHSCITVNSLWIRSHGCTCPARHAFCDWNAALWWLRFFSLGSACYSSEPSFL